MDLNSADICFREEKENWSIKFPMAEKLNLECLCENWKQIAGWTQLPGVLELVGLFLSAIVTEITLKLGCY